MNTRTQKFWILIVAIKTWRIFRKIGQVSAFDNYHSVAYNLAV
jgi:hypothetical protein